METKRFSLETVQEINRDRERKEMKEKNKYCQGMQASCLSTRGRVISGWRVSKSISCKATWYSAG